MTEKFEIRPYRPEDQYSVVRLWETVFPDDPSWNNPVDVIDNKLTVQSELFLICTIDHQLAGTVLAGFDGVRGWVHKLAVFPEFERRGIALSLMKAAEQGLAKLGCPKLNLQVRASNTAVIEFYKKAGYAVEERVSLGKRLDA